MEGVQGHVPENPGSPQPNPFSPTSQTAQSMPSLQMMDAFAQMLQANREQTVALQKTVESLAAARPKSDAGTWTRLLPRPDIFRPQTREDEIAQFGEWKWSFKQYVRAIDSNMSKAMDEVEMQLNEETSLVEMTPEAEEQAQKLYALLTGMVKDRPLQLVRSVEEGLGDVYSTRLLLRTRVVPWRYLVLLPSTQ